MNKIDWLKGELIRWMMGEPGNTTHNQLPAKQNEMKLEGPALPFTSFINQFTKQKERKLSFLFDSFIDFTCEWNEWID